MKINKEETNDSFRKIHYPNASPRKLGQRRKMVEEEDIQVAFIHWVDAHIGEKYDTDYSYGIGAISCGFVVDNNDLAITIGLTMFTDADCFQIITIPKKYILYMYINPIGNMEGVFNATKQSIQETSASGDESGNMEGRQGQESIPTSVWEKFRVGEDQLPPTTDRGY